MPRFAAIDVGSNALRLRIVEASAPSHGPKDQLALLPDRDGRRALAGRGHAARARSPRRRGLRDRAPGSRRRSAKRATRCATSARRWIGRRSTPTGPSPRARCARPRTARRSSSVRGARRASSSRPSRASRRRDSSSSPSRAALPVGDERALARGRGRGVDRADSGRSRQDRLHDVPPARDGADARGLPQGGQDDRPQAREAARGGHRPRARRGHAPARQGRLPRRHGRQRRDALRALPREGPRHRRAGRASAVQEALRDVQQRAS